MPGVRVFDYSLKRFRTNPPEASADLKPHLEDTIPSFEDTDVLDDSDEPPLKATNPYYLLSNLFFNVTLNFPDRSPIQRRRVAHICDVNLAYRIRIQFTLH